MTNKNFNFINGENKKRDFFSILLSFWFVTKNFVAQLAFLMFSIETSTIQIFSPPIIDVIKKIQRKWKIKHKYEKTYVNIFMSCSSNSSK